MTSLPPVGEISLEEAAAKTAAASRAATIWRRSDAAQRVQALSAVWKEIARRREEAIAVVREESGRAALEIELGELGAAALSAGYFLRNAQRLLTERAAWLPWFMLNKRAASRRVPYGVVGVIASRERPFLVPFDAAFRAMLAGNAVLLKPSEWATRTALWLESAAAATGLLPDGLLTVVPGRERAGEAVIDASDLLFFSGTVESARVVAQRAAYRLTPMIREISGRRALIVCEGAPPERAVAAEAREALWHGDGVLAYVEGGAREDFVEALRSRIGPEVFAARVRVVRVERAEEAAAWIDAAVDVSAATIWSSDSSRAERLSSLLDVDSIGINAPPMRAAFRGESLAAFTRPQAVIEHEWPIDAADPWWSPRDPRFVAVLRRLFGL